MDGNASEAPCGSPRPGRFQFRLRTLFLLAMVVAVYGSLAKSLDGLWQIGAIFLFTALLLSIVYWKARLFPALFIVWTAPAIASVLSTVVTLRSDLWARAEFVVLGEVVGIVFSIMYAAWESSYHS